VFLSFSSVFCKFGGRLETTLYIHFTRRWVKPTRHSSALRRKKRGGEAEENAILCSAERWASGFANVASAIDAAEVVKGAASPPAPETWRAAVREAVYATRESGEKSSSAVRD